MPTSLAFYRDVLGFEGVSDVPPDDHCDWVMLKRHESELMLNTAYEAHERTAAPEPARIAAHQDDTLVSIVIDGFERPLDEVFRTPV